MVRPRLYLSMGSLIVPMTRKVLVPGTRLPALLGTEVLGRLGSSRMLFDNNVSHM